jgi:hypothetical protein
MGLGVLTWLPLEFLLPEGDIPPQFAGFLVSIVGMVLGSLIAPASGKPIGKKPHPAHAR